ncbi:hypothetical protein [Dictyobacter formicarum]|uniref:Uncharacterized protein n=1 Tax=Dictyobacter formicarum TaxID=2778368 RepID=A0ABQ3VL74_9CHLR|nr:hypothetical protein [Dictyobacter formicarum]GHO86975.1 hypothetical protein KSZ_49810 [Dictyobacter formicarum]
MARKHYKRKIGLQRINKEIQQQDLPTTKKSEGATRNSARNRRRRASNRDVSSLLLTLGSLFVVGLLLIFGFQFFSHMSDASSTGSNTSNNANSGKAKDMPTMNANTKPDSPWLKPDFIATVSSTLATSLHLSAEQLTTKLQSNMQISDIAAQQGFSADQLHRFELDAMQAGLDKLVSTNQMTQEMADSAMQHFRERDPQQLNNDFTYSLGGTISKDNLPATSKLKFRHREGEARVRGINRELFS